MNRASRSSSKPATSAAGRSNTKSTGERCASFPGRTEEVDKTADIILHVAFESERVWQWLQGEQEAANLLQETEPFEAPCDEETEEPLDRMARLLHKPRASPASWTMNSSIGQNTTWLVPRNPSVCRNELTWWSPPSPSRTAPRIAEIHPQLYLQPTSEPSSPTPPD